MSMKIAVLGGGNGAFAAAADLTEAGHDVHWWRRNTAGFDAIRNSGGLVVTDYRGERKVNVQCVNELAQALAGSTLIVAPVPAFAQTDLARQLAPHLVNGQSVFIPPGTFGAYTMREEIRAQGCQADVAFAETGTLPWLARKHGEAHVAITTRASRLPTGVYPTRAQRLTLDKIMQAFPGAIEPVEDALSAALMNAGPIIHPPLILMNAGPIEHFDRWDIHNEGTQPSVRTVHDALDAERIAIRTALGYSAPHYPLADHYLTSNWMYGNLAHDKLVGSGDWHEALNLTSHRYMSEDIRLGLALLVSIAEWAKVPCPVANGLLTLASAITADDLRTNGRTLENLGLASLSQTELQTLLREGR
jgi:opine dehydrogenase